jgi:hypothetical protein
LTVPSGEQYEQPDDGHAKVHPGFHRIDCSGNRISVAQQQKPEQQKPGPGNFSVLQANEIQIVDEKGTVRMKLQAKRDPPSYNGKGEVIDTGPAIQLLGEGSIGCDIQNTHIIFWDEYSPEQHPFSAIGFSKVFLGLDDPTPNGRVGRLSLMESARRGGGAVHIRSQKKQIPPSPSPSKGSFIRDISPDAIEVIKGTDKR